MRSVACRCGAYGSYILWPVIDGEHRMCLLSGCLQSNVCGLFRRTNGIISGLLSPFPCPWKTAPTQPTPSSPTPAVHDSWSNLVLCDRDTSRSLAWLTQRDVQGAGRYTQSEGMSCQVKETFDPELKFSPFSWWPFWLIGGSGDYSF